jgi:hypothetical protein
MKKLLPATVMALLLSVLVPASGVYADTTSLTVAKDELLASGATRFSLSFILGGATVNITPTEDEDIVVEAVVTHSSIRPAPTLRTDAFGEEFTARFTSGHQVEPDLITTVEEWDVAIGMYDVDTEFTLTGGGIGGGVELGGLPLTDCTVTLGGASIDIDFSSPTTRRVESLNVEGGGITLSMSGIGNTDFEEFSLFTAGSIAHVDFGGAYLSERHTISMVGAGNTVAARVPSDAGEEVSALSIAAPVIVTGSGWETRRWSFIFKSFVTSDYASQDAKIDMNLIQVGSAVTIDRQ